MSPLGKPPRSSTRNMRSASPSKAAPRSQPCSMTAFRRSSFVFIFDRAGRMIRKRAVQLEIDRDHLARQMFEDVRHGLARHAVAGIDCDFERF